MDPIRQYQLDLETRGFLPQPCQAQAVERIQQLSAQLVQQVESDLRCQRWWYCWLRQRPNIQGLYLWGDVGRGKTYLMDLLYSALPFRKKMRIHYHEFMLSIHNALAKLPKQPNPLIRIAQDIADQAYVVCLDEFHVLDITDAMLLSGLLQALFDQHVTLVTTANQPPGDLYEEGLQRSAFLPAIALIEAHTQVVHLTGKVDYRRRHAQQFPRYQAPYGADIEQQLQREFATLSPERSIDIDVAIEVQKRPIRVRQVSDHAVWFDFPAICDSARSSQDYLELAKRFPILFISDVPALGEHNNDAAMRFIRLIDALYDHHNWLILAAQMPLDELYCGRTHRKIFVRITSRLHEMQTDQYLAECQLTHTIDA